MEEESELQQKIFSIELSQDRLKEVLEYNPETGDFIWKIDRTNNAKVGSIAGHWDISKQYWMITLFSIRYPAHTLAWFYVYGEWIRPDHKDRNRLNNRIANLRPATSAQNSANQSVRCTNLLGIKGVQKRGRKFRAYITIDYKTIHLGTFWTAEEAINARKVAEGQYQGEYANREET
jgi:HNH endonuclease